MRAHSLLPASWLTIGVCALAGAAALAAETKPAAGRQLGAHNHGVGTLDVVLEGDTLEIALGGPMANFVGFEHAPRDAAESGALSAVLARLRETADLFSLPAVARCQATSVAIEPPHYAAPDEEHNDEHGNEHHDEHADDDEREDDKADGGDSHAEIAASYSFHCASPAALSHIDVAVFEQFPEMEQLTARVIAPGRQAGTTLTPRKTRLEITRQ